jgi:NADPH-dependent glutamate synthase beta subunit-like oxidoreductase
MPSALPSPSHGSVRHAVAVIGGATAGAEVAARLAGHGCTVAVFEQNPRPYGKVEDGLPRWHHALRHKEYEVIVGKLARPGVHLVPLTKIGHDVGLRELTGAGDLGGATGGWGFSAVVLACGAWRDRPLPIEGADRYLGRGLVYQNPFIIWFNHAGEKGYAGPRFVIEDGAMVVGGGLASIDVVKAHMLETTRAALARRGIDSTVLDLEVGGIPKFLEKHGLTWKELGVQGCTLFYRRRAEDMPLVEAPEGADAARLAKVETGRRKVLEKAREKYLFQVETLAAPDGLVVENGRLVGLRFRRMKVENGRLTPTEETFERRASSVVSSIGSIPDPIPGLPTKGELLAFDDWDLGRMAAYPTLFGAGNVVTGKGNIVASRKHATYVSQRMAEAFLGLGDPLEGGHAGEEGLLAGTAAAARKTADGVSAALKPLPPPAPAMLERLLARVRERQAAVGFVGSVPDWIRAHTPPDFE